MATSLSASRVVDGDPAIALLLITGPEAAEFLPQTTLDQAVPGEVSGVLRLSNGDERALHVVTAPPRRTPIAYISDFRVQIDGLPPITGSLSVTSAGPGRSTVIFNLATEEDFPPDFEKLFGSISGGFFDGLERTVRDHTHAA